MLAAVLLLVACETGDGSAPTGVPDRSREVVVFAAASLAEAFTDLAEAYSAAHPDVRAVVNAAGSQTLAHQIIRGAPGDVFASADATQMAAVADAGHLARPAEVFASNRLAIAVEAGNPLGIQGLADLADPGVVVVLPAEQVPAGAYARQALAAAGVTLTPASLERDVLAARSKVALGEADAAIVYVTDVAGADGRVEGVAIAPDVNVRAAYHIGVLTNATDAEAAGAFLDLVLADQGQEILAQHGLGPP